MVRSPRDYARRQDLPDRYPPYQIVHRRFSQWVDSSVFDLMLQALAEDLYNHGGLDLSECFIDGTFTLGVPGCQKRGASVGPTKRGKGTKVMAIAHRVGLPVAIHIASATPHEVTLVDPTLAANVIDTPPEHLIGDKAYDSDLLDARLAADGIEMIAPHRRGRKKAQT